MARSELIEIGKGAFYLPGAVNVGVIANEQGEALLIDSGGDRDYGRNIRRALEEAELRAVAIVNTHSHADHYGGNDYLVRNLELPVWAPQLEAAILRYPELEPIYLFGGASPLAALRNKWLEAKPSPVDKAYRVADGPLEVAGFTLERHVTSGHAIRQVAFGRGDVCYAADAFFGQEVLDRYEIPFAHDVAGQLDTLDRLLELPYTTFLPGHGAPTDDIAAAVEANRDAILRATDMVLDATRVMATTSDVVHHVTQRLASPPNNPSTYFLMHSTVLAHLAYLTALDEIGPHLTDGMLFWASTR